MVEATVSNIKFEINPIEELKSSITLMRFSNGNQMINVKKSQRGSKLLWNSCIALGMKPWDVPAETK